MFSLPVPVSLNENGDHNHRLNGDHNHRSNGHHSHRFIVDGVTMEQITRPSIVSLLKPSQPSDETKVHKKSESGSDYRDDSKSQNTTTLSVTAETALTSGNSNLTTAQADLLRQTSTRQPDGSDLNGTKQKEGLELNGTRNQEGSELNGTTKQDGPDLSGSRKPEGSNLTETRPQEGSDLKETWLKGGSDKDGAWQGAEIGGNVSCPVPMLPSQANVKQ